MPSPIPPRVFAGDSFIESNGVSSQISVEQADGNRGVNGHYDVSATPTQRTPNGAKQGRPEATNSVDNFMAHDPQESEALRIVNVTFKGKQRQALLLTTDMLERLHTIGQLRQQLRQVESDIAIRAERSAGTMTQTEIDAQRETFAIPGAFPLEENAHTEASQRSVFFALQKKISIKDRSNEKLKAQRSNLMAELDRLQQLVLESLVEVIDGNRAD